MNCWLSTIRRYRLLAQVAEGSGSFELAEGYRRKAAALEELHR